MIQYIDKSALVAEIESIKKRYLDREEFDFGWNKALERIISFIDTLEVKDPYEQCIQYSSIEDGIKAHAEIYSFNIESELFNQLTKEQQALWRKEIEQACVSGGDVGATLTRDQRYKENAKVKEVDSIIIAECCDWLAMNTNLSNDKIEDCRNLMLTIKEEQLKEQKGG